MTNRSRHDSLYHPVTVVAQVYLFQGVSYSWPDRDFRENFLCQSLSSSMIVRTKNINGGWQLVDVYYDDDVVFTGLSEENNCQAKLDWHRVASGLNMGKWESSSMRLLAAGVLEVTRKMLLPHLLHPEAQDATSTTLYRPYTGHI